MNSLATACRTGTVFHAQPYPLDAQGFYFHSYEDYEDKASKISAEEFEIQLIDADDVELISACRLDQTTLHWLEDIQKLDSWQKPAVFFLLDNGLVSDVGEAIAKADDVCLFSGTLQDAAVDLFDDCYASQVPEGLRVYVDYEKFANDLRLSGDFVEFRYGGETYCCTNANGF